MKASFIAFGSLLASTLAAPANHGHNHAARRHNHKRDYVIVWETITVGEDGQALATVLETTTEHQAAADVATDATTSTSTPVVVAVTSVTPTTTAAVVQDAVPATSSTSVSSTSTTTSSSTASTSTSVTTAAAASATSSSSSDSSSDTSDLALEAGSVANPLSNGVSPTETFTDGTIACSSFPSAQPGVLELDYLGFGGYTGIQIDDGAGSSCVAGALCSYACQPGMLKTQWPTTQPTDGESRGGLTCGSDGMLYLSDSSKPYLCEWGENSAFASSSLSEGVAICQTDYPGSENMVIPTWVAPGATAAPLSVVVGATYYQWEGQATSSQFYVNNAGVSQEDGCLWGTEGSGVGNYSPLNFGAGYSDGVSWLAMFPNPGASSTLNFNIKFEAASGSTINGDCAYVDGAFTGTSASTSGCTIACTGTCYFVFY